MRLSTSLGGLAAAFLFLSAFAHALLGWPEVAKTLRGAGLAADFVAGQAAGWFFGSLAMAVFGVLTLTSLARFRRGRDPMRGAMTTVGLAYCLFGSVAFVLRDFELHFLGFLTIGALELAYALRLPGAQPGAGGAVA